jgi:polyisoprenoid-binding protein YceI
MKPMKIRNAVIFAGTLTTAGLLPGLATAEVENYVIDTEGAHAFIQFRIKHLGYSWLYGRFNDFGGSFTFDTENPDNSSIQVDIKTASLDSNHAERDKHLRSEDFLDVGKYPDAGFKSTAVSLNEDGTGTLTGDFTLRGITKPVSIEIEQIGTGVDPWGGYRRGFQGSTSFALKDFGIDYDLGPASQQVEIILSVEGIRQDG